jgi:cobalt-precorrin-5B (C1)-methyltransferase
LKSGYTTGACAAAAAKGAAEMLRDGQMVERVEIILPGGELVPFTPRNQQLGDNFASCSVIKDAGDDPDVTNGAEINVSLTMEPAPQGSRGGVVICGGTGIGRVTKPGLAVPVGEWAINPVPRRMIHVVINEIFAIRCVPSLMRVTVSIPNGEELAKRTLNSRLGIVGGLSILGTTGIVKPISTQAWTDTIDTAIDVALACSSDTLILSTGRTSELAAERHLQLGKLIREEAFVMMGDHAGHALRSCATKGVGKIVIAGQFAKLLKIACGHEQTHVSSSELDLQQLASWLDHEPAACHLAPLARRANTARQVLEESGNDPALAALVCRRVVSFAAPLAPGSAIKVLLAGYGQEVLYFG